MHRNIATLRSTLFKGKGLLSSASDCDFIWFDHAWLVLIRSSNSVQKQHCFSCYSLRRIRCGYVHVFFFADFEWHSMIWWLDWTFERSISQLCLQLQGSAAEKSVLCHSWALTPFWQSVAASKFLELDHWYHKESRKNSMAIFGSENEDGKFTMRRRQWRHPFFICETWRKHATERTRFVICEVAFLSLVRCPGSTSAFLISLNCNGSQLRHFRMMPNRAHDTCLKCDEWYSLRNSQICESHFYLIAMRNLFSAFFRRMQAKPKQPEAHGERRTWCLPFRLVQCQNHMMPCEPGCKG